MCVCLSRPGQATQSTLGSQKAQDKADERSRFMLLRQGLEKARMLVGQLVRRERLKRDLAATARQAFDLQTQPLTVRVERVGQA